MRMKKNEPEEFNSGKYLANSFGGFCILECKLYHTLHEGS